MLTSVRRRICLQPMREGELVAKIRADAGLSLRALADAAGLATSTVHRIEQGKLRPTLETLRAIAEAGGVHLAVTPEVDYSVSIVGLALSIRTDLALGDEAQIVRKAAELVHCFQVASDDQRGRMIEAEPPPVGDPQWDAFLAALAEWMAVRSGTHVPAWVHKSARYLPYGWWVTPMKSMRAWEYAGSPASFQIRGVYVHRDSLTNV